MEEVAKVISQQAVACRKNPELWGELIEQIASSLGFTIALAAQGDADKIDTLMTGAEAHAHATAVERAPLAALMALRLR